MKRSQVYKRIFALVLMFVMPLLAACGGQKGVDQALTEVHKSRANDQRDQSQAVSSAAFRFAPAGR